MTARSTGPCPSAETLAAFVDGRLSREEIRPLLDHLDVCERCSSAVAGTNERRPSASGWTWKLAAAAAIVAIVIAIPVFRRFTEPASPAARLVALSPRTARIVQPRLSGGFAYAPYEGPMRAADAAADTRRLKLAGAAGEIVEQADRDHSPANEHAAGLALTLIERPLDAMPRLRAAAERSPNDAHAWSDLAAATYAAALRHERPSLYPMALDAADRALRIDPKLPEALFNRALTLERLGLPAQARDAWTRYLATDASSPWATEAREHLAKLPTATSEMEFRGEQPRLERGDQREVDAVVARFRQQSRTFAEGQYLALWAEALTRGDEPGARQQLEIARQIGDALQRQCGESLLAEAVRDVETSPRARELAAAQLAYRRARIAFSRREPAAAEDDLRAAAAQFGSNPMSLVSRYYAASARFDRNDAATARRELEALLAAVPPRFIALGAQVRWELALCLMIDDDWTGALPLLDQAAAAFQRLDERTNLAVMETMRADAMSFLGRPDDAWSARIRALAILSAEGRGNRLPLTIGEAARMELRAGRIESARALLAIEETAVRASHDDVILADTLVREAVLKRHLGDDPAALAHVREAFAAANRIADPALRERALADARFAEGATSLPSDARKAERSLSLAIDHYRGTDKSFFLPEAQLLRARARMRIGDEAGARADLDGGIGEVERHRAHLAGAANGTGVIDAASALFEDAIRMCLDRGDVAGAFAYSDRWRGGGVAPGDAAPAPVEALQRRLASSDAAVLELVVLRDEVVAFCITARGITAERRAATGVAELVDRGDEAALYELLVRPTERSWSQARSLIVVAAPPLDEVPFAALYDAQAKRHLVERVAVLLAPSAGALRADGDVAAPRSIAAIALPAGGDAPSLPAGDAELDEITRLYAERRAVPAARATFAAMREAASGADVVHIAGHTERQPGGGEDALLFAGNEAVSWRGIAAHPLHAPLVVVAACETLRVPRSAQARAMSVAGGFLAAGARDVIGTLTPLADEQARAIFTSIHRNLSRGIEASESLRDAQLEALAGESASGRRTAWRAVALLTTRIPRAGK